MANQLQTIRLRMRRSKSLSRADLLSLITLLVSWTRPDQTTPFFYKNFALFIQVFLYLSLYLAERRSSASSLVRSQLLIRDRIRQPVPAVPINIRDLAHIYRSYRSNSFHHPGRTIWRPLPNIAKGTMNLKYQMLPPNQHLAWLIAMGVIDLTT